MRGFEDNNKLRIGIWLGDVRQLDSNGASSYSDAVKNGVLSNHLNAEICFISTVAKTNIEGFKTFPINFKYCLFLYSIFVFISRLIEFFPIFRVLGIAKLLFESIYRKSIIELYENIDIIYYPVPVKEVLPEFPFIFTVWDLGHLNTYPFPELSMHYAFETRVNFYNNNLKKALFIFAESEIGKQQLVEYQNIFPEKVYVLPMPPSIVVSNYTISVKPDHLGLEDKFIHYCAHFWAHKNHINLIIAFNDVIKTHPEVKLVLSGLDKGVRKYVENYITKIKIWENIILVDRFSIEELKWLYQNSAGLVYTSFLGPSNMPLVEAKELNCPVICSNLKGHIEQLGDYAKYFDPKSPSDISRSIIRMLESEDRASRVLRTGVSSANKFINSLNDTIYNIQAVRRTWE